MISYAMQFAGVETRRRGKELVTAVHWTLTATDDVTGDVRRSSGVAPLGASTEPIVNVEDIDDEWLTAKVIESLDSRAQAEADIARASGRDIEPQTFDRVKAELAAKFDAPTFRRRAPPEPAPPTRPSPNPVPVPPDRPIVRATRDEQSEPRRGGLR